MFPVQRPGEDIIAEWELLYFFFYHFANSFFLGKNIQYFLTKKKEKKEIKKMVRPPDWPHFDHLLDRKQTIF